MTHAIDPLDGATQGRDRFQTVARRVVFCLIMAFIYFGPAPGQLFGKHSPWLREWVMFAGVGVGIPKGTFTVTHSDGTVDTHTPLDAAGLKRYPIMIQYLFEGRLTDAEDLGRFAAALCDRTPATSDVSFEGVVGTRQGWRPLRANDVCDEREMR